LKNGFSIKDDFSTLGIIPARGGSKGVKRKNIRVVAGRPLIAYSINAAKQSKYLTRFVVSTEDNEIAEVASSLGSKVLFRPPELAEDHTPMLPVIKHVLREAEKLEQNRFDCVVILQPTSPLRTGSDIDQSLEIIHKSNCDTVISVYQVSDHHPSRMYSINNGKLIPFAPESPARLRQKLPPVYHRNGAIYALWRKTIDEQNTLIGKNICPYIMSIERSVNIDDEIDLMLADLLIRKMEDNEISHFEC
jgi:CMP-N,N'-diacetyllegionaminic acid synthase